MGLHAPLSQDWMARCPPLHFFEFRCRMGPHVGQGMRGVCVSVCSPSSFSVEVRGQVVCLAT